MNESAPTSARPASSPQGGFGLAVLKAWLVVGTLDGLAAVIQHLLKGGRAPQRIFQYIASGLFGQSARQGGWPMVAAGVVFHYFFALAFTLLFFAAYPRLPAWRRHALVIGILYGAFIWSVMNLIVVPLSAIPASPMQAGPAAIAAAILIVAIGLPLAFFARRYEARRQK